MGRDLKALIKKITLQSLLITTLLVAVVQLFWYTTEVHFLSYTTIQAESHSHFEDTDWWDCYQLVGYGVTESFLGVPTFVVWYFCKKFSIEWPNASDWYWLYLFIPLFFYVLPARILLFYASKFKWKYAASLLVIVLFVWVNVWGSKVHVRGMLTPDWKTYRFDSFHFSIDSPYPLREEQDNSPQNSGKINVVRETRVKTTNVISLARVTVNCAEFKNDKHSLEFEKNYWQNNLGNIKISSATCSGLPAIIINETPYSFWLVVVKGRLKWTFIVNHLNYFDDVYPADSKKMADRIFQSIKIQDVQ